MRKRTKLGVNIDHIATLRNARGEGTPDLIIAAKQVIAAGADSIVAHLREDRRHIKDKDIYDIRRAVDHFDMEMAATAEMLKIALDVKPDIVTLVPEKRKELTTEGGLDVVLNFKRLSSIVEKLESKGIHVSMFIDPQKEQIEASRDTGASFIEIHTGKYALSNSDRDLAEIIVAAKYATRWGLKVNAGHGLNYENVKPIAELAEVVELNIGFSIIARSVFSGLEKAVKGMRKLITVIFVALAVPYACDAATLETYSVTSEVMIAPVVVVPPEVKAIVEIKAETIKQQRLVDVPTDHWASRSVDDLVRMGVTQGYPDGTFRGNNNLSRYEMAIFLSKMSERKGVAAATNEKLMSELRMEIYKLRYTLNMYKKKPTLRKPYWGTFFSSLRFGNVVTANSASSSLNAPIGPVFDYRIIYNFQHDFNDDSFLRIGLDTMDSSTVQGRDLARQVLEMEAQTISKSGLGINVSAGPGAIVHRENTPNIFPAEDKIVYLRQSNGFKVFYSPGVIDTGIGYKATAYATGDSPAINDIYGYIGYTFKGTNLGDVTVKYTANDFNNDLRATFSTAEAQFHIYDIKVEPSGWFEYGMTLAVRSGVDNPHNAFFGINLITKNLFKMGSTLKFFACKVGSDLFPYPVYQGVLGTNIYNKFYEAGTYDVAFQISQAISKDMTVRMTADIVTGPNGEYTHLEPKANATFDLGMDIGVYESAVMTLMYKLYQVPSAVNNNTSDMIGLGFRYNY